MKNAKDAMSTAQLWVDELAKQHAKTHEGVAMRDPRGELQFKSPEDKEAYAKAYGEKLNTTMVEIPISKFPFRALTALKLLTPAELEAMEPILEGIPDPEDASAGKGSNIVLPGGRRR